MNKSAFAILVSLAAYNAPALANEVLKVEEFTADPVYSMTVDSGDKAQLTDGTILRPPLWINSKGVGWTKRSPVGIYIRFMSTNRPNTEAATLRVHVGKNSGAGVLVPSRYDVYSIDAANKYTHVGGVSITQAKLAERQSHWIDIPVARHAAQIFLVVHADGGFIMMDEIAWISGIPAGATPPKVSESFPSVLAAITDSGKRIAQAAQGASAAAQAALVDQLTSPAANSGFSVWAMPPYEPDLNNYVAANIATLSKQIDIKGTNREKESFIIGISNQTATVKQISFSPSSAATGYVSFNLLDSVTAANGAQVYDPLLPMAANSFAMKGEKINYIWVTVDLSKAPIGDSTFNITVSDGSASRQAIAVNTNVKAITPLLPVVKACAWSYPTHKPIWNNPAENLKDLTSHRVNVLTTNNIPPFTADGAVPLLYRNRLINELKFLRGSGQILVYVGWPKWIPANVLSLPDPALKNAVRAYVKAIDEAAVAAGLGYSEWAFYPVDEPYGLKTAFLKKVAPWIKSVNPNIRIYANPITTSIGTTTAADLQYLAPYVDYWQPNIPLALKEASFFQLLGKEWWSVYANLHSPSKAEPPVSFRFSSWASWGIGSNGSGVWAYSNTEGSSAWSDTDGTRADFTLVYESATGPISSRRWEAYRDGVEDHELLKVFAKSRGALAGTVLDSVKTIIQSNRKPTTRDVDTMRTAVLKGL